MKRNRYLALALFLVVALLASACGSDDDLVDVGAGGDDGSVPTTTSDDDSTNDGTDSGTRPTLRGLWLLQSFTLDGTEVPLPAGTIDMTIEDGRIRGTGGCNSFGGQIDVTDRGGLAIIEMAWTEMACAETDRMDFEAKYLPALAGATSWTASPEGITFSSDTAKIAYGPGEPPATLPLEGTAWELDTVFAGSGVERTASTTDQSKPSVMLVLEDGVATLTADDCGPITVPLNYEPGTDGNLVVVDREASDKPSCDDPASNMVIAIDALFEASGFMVAESRLTLIGLPGELVGFRGE